MKIPLNPTGIIRALCPFLLVCAAAPALAVDSFTNALIGGKVYADFRLRFETVDQDNALANADALTLRSRLGYLTDEYAGFSAGIEMEDSRTVFGVNDFSVPPTGFKPGEFSVIADPEATEVDQGFVQYKSNGLTGKLGRQIITLDTHRFVGHVGWRQDRQTFDAFSVSYKANDKFNLYAAQLVQRNRIFAEERDIESDDSLLNVSYKTSIGKLSAYAYLLEEDKGAQTELDTFGMRFSGSHKAGETKILYAAEYATQELNDAIDTDYIALEFGAQFAGITAKLGYELLGSDNEIKGFATPLATLHKFNGWSDQFLGTPNAGLQDFYLRAAGKVGGGKWLAVYHDFSSDFANSGIDDLGNEINLQYTRNFGKHYYSGIKFASYSAGDASFGKVDSDKLWLWAGAKF